MNGDEYPTVVGDNEYHNLIYMLHRMDGKLLYGRSEMNVERQKFKALTREDLCEVATSP